MRFYLNAEVVIIEEMLFYDSDNISSFTEDNNSPIFFTDISDTYLTADLLNIKNQIKNEHENKYKIQYQL